MTQEEWASTADFLLFADGNVDRSSFLLGYVAAYVPADVRFHAMVMRQRFEDAGAAWRGMHQWAVEELQDPHD